MKYSYIISLCFLALLLTGGCSLSREAAIPDDDGWQDEVLIAHDCGLDGLRCCVGQESPCRYEMECCTDPHNLERSMCANNCACGGLGRFCCKDEPQCDDGLACSDGNCAPCGEADQPCCAGADECHGDLICHKNKCVSCGQPGTPCCAEGISCASQDALDFTHTECRKGVCVFCGTGGKVPCESDPSCISGNLLNNNRCFRCGDFNQPCCDVNSVTSYQCNPEKNLECKLGFCSK